MKEKEGEMKRILAMVTAVVLGLFIALPAMAQNEVVVGSVTPLSGKLSVYGEGFQQAMLLALDEVNQAGGIKGKPMKILYEDNMSTAKGSVSAIQKLITIHKLPII